MKNVEKQTLSCRPPVPVTLTLFNPELIQKTCLGRHFQSYLHLHMGHFLGTPCILIKTLVLSESFLF